MSGRDILRHFDVNAIGGSKRRRPLAGPAWPREGGRAEPCEAGGRALVSRPFTRLPGPVSAALEYDPPRAARGVVTKRGQGLGAT
jgi:hypothetical protein